MFSCCTFLKREVSEHTGIAEPLCSESIMSRFLKDSLPHLRERVTVVCLALPSSLRLNTHRERTFVYGQWAKAVSHSKYSSGFSGSCAASSCLPPRYLRGGVGVSLANWAGDVSSESANGEHVTQPQMNPVQPPRTEDAEPLRCRCCQRTKKNYTTSEKNVCKVVSKSSVSWLEVRIV